MKTPNEIIKYKNKVLDILDWAVGQGHINEDQRSILADNIEEIEYDMYPRETYVDENGWTQIKEE